MNTTKLRQQISNQVGDLKEYIMDYDIHQRKVTVLWIHDAVFVEPNVCETLKVQMFESCAYKSSESSATLVFYSKDKVLNFGLRH